ncbi:MAG: hypothetical protein WAO76_07340 [Georgfuchsia sp.]
MNMDIENADKAAQVAELLEQDLMALVASPNPLVSDIALAMKEEATALRIRLERLFHNLQAMETTA